mmetsp:Transcript_51143/g.130136  ORF Transcript_51143/g.130136 Transcript_51143/m.130136 type:complete len:792 (+) Transcript_51143:117-2492(+)
MAYCAEINRIKAQFNGMDKNGDGFLNYKEMSVLLKKINPELDYKEMMRLFKLVDKDGNGSIDFYEFVDFIFAGCPIGGAALDDGGGENPGEATGVTSAEGGDAAGDDFAAAAATPLGRARSRASLSRTAPAALLHSGAAPGAGVATRLSVSEGSGPRKPPTSVNSPAIFSDLAGREDEICAIDLVEERGITLAQLEALYGHIAGRCEAEMWSDLQLVSRTYGQALDPLSINLYQVVDWVVKPATEQAKCSFVEFVATCSYDQRPRWFVSHWWGESLLAFITCIRCHSTDRALGEYSPYWICAYANNQWNVHGEVGADPAESSFHKAMLNAEGTVSVIDAQAVCYTRVWCCYEVWLSLGLSATRSWPFRYDMYMSVDGDSAVGLTDGLAAADMLRDEALWVQDKVDRESRFPLDVAHQMLNVRLQDAKASCDADRARILNSIIGAPDVDALPPAEHDFYEELNDALSGRFAAAMWRNALEARQTMADYGEVLSSSGLYRLHVALSNSDAFTDKAAAMLGSSLPQTLQEVDLDLSDTRITNIDELGGSFMRLHGLSTLKLSFTRCMRLKHLQGLDRGLEGLGALGTLRLCFSACDKLRSIDELGRGLAATSNLTSLYVNCHNCTSLLSIDELGVGIACLKGLRSLSLSFDGCMELTSVDALGRGLQELSELTSLQINMNGCNGLQDVDGLGRGLASLTRLDQLRLYLDNCEQLESIEEISRSLVHIRSLLSLELWFSNTAVSSIGELGRNCLRQRDLEYFSLNARACRNLPEGLQIHFESLQAFQEKLEEEEA